MSETGPDSTGRLESPLAAALARVQAQLPKLGKDETGKVKGVTKDGKPFEYEYSYADLASVSRAVFPLLGANGLAFTAFPTVVDRGFVLRYSLLHEDGEVMSGDYPLAGTTAQQRGSEITYARRYCLCAVTGIAPDEDDDAAAATQQAQTQFPTAPTELDTAKQRVYAAWTFQFGDFKQPEVEAHYRAWSDGGALTSADPAELRRYAAYLSNLPKEEAGSEPDAAPSAIARYDAPKMSTGQRGLLFKLMGEIGLDDKGSQLQWINKQLVTEYESRALITAGDAKVLIDGLQKGIDAPPSELA